MMDVYGKQPTVFDGMSQAELLVLMAAILKKASCGRVTLTDTDIRTMGDQGECLVFWRTPEGYHFDVMTHEEAQILHDRTRNPTLN